MTDPRPAQIARGASRGFTILLLGGAVQPLIVRTLPALGAVWLVLVAVVAFAASARAAGREGVSCATGAAAALAGFALILPLAIVGSGAVGVSLVTMTGLTALVVGGGTAWLSTRLAGRSWFRDARRVSGSAT